MLDTIRKYAKGWVATFLIGLLVLSFALWGVADVFTGYGSNSVASVGGNDIDLRTFQRAYESELRTAGQRLGTPITNQQAVVLGIPNRIMGQLIADATVEKIADNLGLGISNDNLNRIIQTDPSLQGATGRFNRSALQYVLTQAGMTENEFVIGREKNALRQQLADGLVGQMTVPSAYMEAFNAFQNEQRSADYIVLSASDLPELEEPSDPDLRTYFEANKATFQAPEFRSFDLLAIEPDTISDAASVSDEDARQEYESVKDTKYGAPERRDFQQLLFADATSAQAASAKIDGGMSFEDIVAAEGKELSDLGFGLKAKSEIIDEAIAEATFSLPLNGVSKVVDGRFGSFIIRVTDIRPEAVLPFDEVKEVIKKDIAARNAESEVFRLYDEIEDARAGGSTLKEIAERFKLELRNVKMLDRNGKTDDGSGPELPEQGTLLSEVFQTDIGEEADAVQLGRRGFAWFDVTDIVPERDRMFEDAKDRVIVAWRADKLKTQLDDKAAEMVKALKIGGSLADQALPLGIEVKKAEEISRSASPEGVPVSLTTAVFDGPDGHSGSTTGADAESRIVFKVTSANEPAYFEEAEGNAETRQQLAQALQQTVMMQYVQKAQTDLGVTINNQAIGYVLGLNGQGQGQ